MSSKYCSNLGLQSPEHHKAVLDADPENVRARMEYAHALLETDALEEAAAVFRTVLDQPSATCSQLGQVRLVLGKINVDLGRKDEAIEHLREALVLRPTHPTVLLDLGWLLNSEGKRTEARALWQRVLDAWPNGGPQYQIEECRRLLEQYPDEAPTPQPENG